MVWWNCVCFDNINQIINMCIQCKEWYGVQIFIFPTFENTSWEHQLSCFKMATVSRCLYLPWWPNINWRHEICVTGLIGIRDVFLKNIPAFKWAEWPQQPACLRNGSRCCLEGLNSLHLNRLASLSLMKSPKNKGDIILYFSSIALSTVCAGIGILQTI